MVVSHTLDDVRLGSGSETLDGPAPWKPWPPAEPGAGVAELVDADTPQVSGHTPVRVRISASAPTALPQCSYRACVPARRRIAYKVWGICSHFAAQKEPSDSSFGSFSSYKNFAIRISIGPPRYRPRVGVSG